MKNVYFIILLILFSFFINEKLSAQSRWSNIYYPDEDAYGANLSLSYDKGYLLVGKHGHNYVNYNWMIKTDINGEVLWEKTLGEETSNIFINNLDYNALGDMYLVGLTGYYADEDYDPLIMKLNACGEKQWCRVFLADGMNSVTALEVTQEGDVVVVLVSMGDILTNTDRICLAKFDVQGTMLWKECYNSNDTALYNSDAYDLTKSPDGGFLITGACGYQDPNPPHYLYWKPYYIKTDSLGNFEWETVAHKEISKTLGGWGWSSEVSPDQQYYYSSISHYYHPGGDAATLLKMDMSGNVIATYDLAEPGEYGKMIEAKFITDSTLVASAVWGSVGAPKAVIIDTLGNIVDQANLLDNEWMAWTENDQDGKLLFFTNQNDNSGNFDAYLFKLNRQLDSDTLYTQQFTYDSLCPYKIVSDTIVQDDCELIVDNHYLTIDNKRKNELIIYPNPAAGSFVIRNKRLNTQFIKIEIFDLFGQTIKTIKTIKSGSDIMVNAGNWKKGIYIVKAMYKNGKIDTGKVVLQ